MWVWMVVHRWMSDKPEVCSGCTPPLAWRQLRYMPPYNPTMKKQLGDGWMDNALQKKRRFVNVTFFILFYCLLFKKNLISINNVTLNKMKHKPINICLFLLPSPPRSPTTTTLYLFTVWNLKHIKTQTTKLHQKVKAKAKPEIISKIISNFYYISWKN